MTIKRENPTGLIFEIKQMEEGTLISLNEEKHIMVDMTQDEVSQCWFNWTMRGQYVQEAFSKLNPAEREFLITGLTPKEWDELWGKFEY